MDTPEKVFPKDLYNASFIQRFIRQCEKVNVEWAIFSDKYAFVFPHDKITWYEKHPGKVLKNKIEFKQLLDQAYQQIQKYETALFYHNPGRLHPLYKLLIRELRGKGLKIEEITHLCEIEENIETKKMTTDELI